MTNFSGLGLIEPIQRAIAAEGYTVPTPIQARSIPPLLLGRDLIGVAQTGTGKTAAFVLPLLQRLSQAPGRAVAGRPRALVLAPTRELAGQIHQSARTYGRHLGLSSAVIFGGVSMVPQAKALASGTDILVATPGRLLDLMNQRRLFLDRIEIFVLDEADRMLDMGFINDVRKIIRHLPEEYQAVLFSATMPDAVRKLASGITSDAVGIDVAPKTVTAERIDQRVLFVDKHDKRDLISTLLGDEKIERVLVFTRTKHGADRVARHLTRDGVRVEALHGNKSQNARERALKDFRSGRLRALVATDIAARGIDIDSITHVINFDLPNDPESYVHRIGRTARAGASGMAISFCDETEHDHLRKIERLTGRSIERGDDPRNPGRKRQSPRPHR